MPLILYNKGNKGRYKGSTIRGQTRVIFVGWTYQLHNAATHKNDPCSPTSPQWLNG